MKRYAPIAFAALMICLAPRGIAAPPFNVDDPMTTEAKHYNVAISYSSSQVDGGEAQVFPYMSWSYGLNNRVELNLGYGAISTRTSGSARIAGFGDIAAGARWRFKDETKNSPQFALGYSMKIPTASRSRGLGTGAFDHSFWVSAGKSFKRLYVFSNVGCTLVGSGDAEDNLFYGIGSAYQLTDKLIVGAQVYGNTSPASGASDELAWSAAAIYNLRADFGLFFGVGRSERHYSDLNITTGVSITFK